MRLAAEGRMLLLMHGQCHEMMSLSQRIEPLVSATTSPDAAALFWDLRSLGLQSIAGERSAAASLKAVEVARQGGDARKRAVVLTNAIMTASLPADTKVRLLHELREVMVPSWQPHMQMFVFEAEAAIAWGQGDLQRARTAFMHAADVARSRRWRLNVLSALVELEHVLGLLEEAIAHAREAVDLARACGESNLIWTLAGFAGVAADRGDFDEARTALNEAVAISRRTGWHKVAHIGRRLALLAAREGRVDDAARVLGFLRRFDDKLAITGKLATTLSLAQQAVCSKLAPRELELRMAEGAANAEAAICAIGLAPSAALASARSYLRRSDALQ
jgi:tetratricopeptide (TPR) repeat protein